MKKFILLFLLFAFSTSYSQLIRGYGLKLGATFSTQEWEYLPSLAISFVPDKRVGLNLGIFAELLNHSPVSIVTELNYIQKGMKKEIEKTTEASPEGTGEFITWNSRIDYINVSVLAKFRLEFGILSPYVIAGPKIDFEINKVLSFNDENIAEENFKKERIGVKVGLGSEINLLKLKMLIEFLYDADFNELYQNQNLKINTSSIDLRIGIFL